MCRVWIWEECAVETLERAGKMGVAVTGQRYSSES